MVEEMAKETGKFGLKQALKFALRYRLFSRWAARFSEPRLYGVEKLLDREIIKIAQDGSYTSETFTEICANVRNIWSVELCSRYFGPLKDIDIEILSDSFQVIPPEYGPVTLVPSPITEGFFKLTFAKPLEPGDKVVYTYKEKSDGVIYTPTRNGYSGACSFELSSRTIFYPTQKLELQIFFESGYPVSVNAERPRAIVWYGEALTEHQAETQRIQKHFTLTKYGAKLAVPRPIHGLEYAIYWGVTK